MYKTAKQRLHYFATAVFVCKDIILNNPDFNDEIKNALQMTILKMCEDWFFADTYNYSERFQLLKSDKSKYQNILHESYPENQNIVR